MKFFRLSTSPAQSTTVVWTGRPWITPDAIARTIPVIIVGAVIIWLENLDNAASSNIIGLPVWTWTALIFFFIWIVSLAPLVGLVITHKYTLRGGSLEVKTGIVSLQTFVLSPSGFSDLEIDQGLTGASVVSATSYSTPRANGPPRCKRSETQTESQGK
jgi:cellobiose-specific phosphotransferase system component IIC